MKIIHAGDELVIRNTINLRHEDKHGIPEIIIHVRIIQSYTFSGVTQTNIIYFCLAVSVSHDTKNTSLFFPHVNYP